MKNMINTKTQRNTRKINKLNKTLNKIAVFQITVKLGKLKCSKFTEQSHSARKKEKSSTIPEMEKFVEELMEKN